MIVTFEMREHWAKHVYLARWNYPGCMPDVYPVRFGDPVRAWEYLHEMHVDRYDTDIVPTFGLPCEGEHFPGVVQSGGVVYAVDEFDRDDPILADI